MNIGEQIAKYRKERHLTQEQLGEALGVTNRTVSKWESGVSSPGVDLIPTIVSALGISLDQLFGTDTQRDTAAISKIIKDMTLEITDAIEYAIRDAARDTLPDALHGALEELLPEYVSESASQEHHSLSVFSKNKTRICIFRGKGQVNGPCTFNNVPNRWIVQVNNPGDNVNVGDYDSKEEAADALERIFKAYSNGITKIEL